MTCLRAEVDNMDSYRSLVSTLGALFVFWCQIMGHSLAQRNSRDLQHVGVSSTLLLLHIIPSQMARRKMLSRR